VEEGTTVDKRRDRRLKNEATRRVSMILNLRRSPEDKEAATTEEAVEAAEDEVEGEVVTDVAHVRAAKGLETSLERIRTTTRRERARDVKEVVVKAAEDEATPADDPDDSEDAHVAHQHRVQETKEVTTATTTAAETNTLITNDENAMTIVVTVETEETAGIEGIAETGKAIVMAKDRDVADMDATEKS